jgi:hypothetical protein
MPGLGTTPAFSPNFPGTHSFVGMVASRATNSSRWRRFSSLSRSVAWSDFFSASAPSASMPGLPGRGRSPIPVPAPAFRATAPGSDREPRGTAGKIIHGEEVLPQAALETQIRGLNPDLSRVLLQLQVSGMLDLSARNDFEQRISTALGSALRTRSELSCPQVRGVELRIAVCQRRLCTAPSIRCWFANRCLNGRRHRMSKFQVCF